MEETKTIERVIPEKEATKVVRSPRDPWEWPAVAYTMISDSFKVLGTNGLGANALNGDPLQLAYAVNFLESLYANGYAVVKLK